MIDKPTTLVLGAGASMPYGFPSGGGLTNEATGMAGLPSQLEKLGFKEEEYQAFKHLLAASQQGSIDAFLEWRTKFIDIGKALIAHALVKCERQEPLIASKDSRWYKQLLNSKLSGSSLEEFANNKLSVITFNYDRSFEHFLFTALRARFGKTDEEVARILNRLEIVHVHGRMGRLSWQDGDEEVRDYSPVITPVGLKIAADGIKIVIQKELDHSEEIKKAREILDQSENVFFFGFGYGSVNMERLDLKKKDGRLLTGTASGFSPQQAEKLGRDYPLTIGEWCITHIHEFMNTDSAFVNL